MLPNEMAYPPEGLFGKNKRNFAASPEDNYNNLAQYYDIPALSFRNAVYQLGDNGQMGKTWADFMGADRLHPNDLGHKVRACWKQWGDAPRDCFASRSTLDTDRQYCSP
jgi:hypothetical protein